MITALIVDDAPIVRRGIRLLLQDEGDIDVVGEASDGPEAVEVILGLQPDLVFLDIQMPGFGGFEVLERTKMVHPQAVIFITAFDDYALRAFDAKALDYLLKPINPERFHDALLRVRRVLASEDMSAPSKEREREVSGPRSADAPLKPNLVRLLVRERDRFILLKTEEVDWVAAEGEYVKLHARSKSFLTHMAISDLEEKLDPLRFTRIHRSTIVNLDRIKEIRARSHGDCDVVLNDGTLLRMSRNYRNRVFAEETNRG